MKVVSSCDFSASGICQNPLHVLASSLLKTVTPDSCARVSSTFGSGWTSRRTFSFRGFRSTQILIAPSFFGTTTIPAHHGVGWSTLAITPNFSMRSSSSLTLERRGIVGHILGQKGSGVLHLA